MKAKNSKPRQSNDGGAEGNDVVEDLELGEYSGGVTVSPVSEVEDGAAMIHTEASSYVLYLAIQYSNIQNI